MYPGKQTRLVGYDGLCPGPTFVMEQGVEAIVRFINHGDRANSVHLHGSYSRAPFDGWAEDITGVGQYKDYYYPNTQNARTLWYHDHAIDHTAENAYYGQAGFYILHDPEERALGLPEGKYDIPLALAAKRYNKDYSLWDPEKNGETTSVYGDVIHVNGQPWPFLNVEPRKYRFRWCNTGISRSYLLYLELSTAAGKKLPFTVTASDAGLLEGPIIAKDLYMSMAERWEIVIDFAPYAGKKVTVRNDKGFSADSDFTATDRVMRKSFPPPKTTGTDCNRICRGQNDAFWACCWKWRHPFTTPHCSLSSEEIGNRSQLHLRTKQRPMEHQRRDLGPSQQPHHGQTSTWCHRSLATREQKWRLESSHPHPSDRLSDHVTKRR